MAVRLPFRISLLHKQDFSFLNRILVVSATGNVIDVPALEQQAGRADATSAFAQAPAKYTARKTSVYPNSPAETGGGSEGYNWNLAHSNDY